MITLLTGANSFEIERFLTTIIDGFSGDVEKYQGSELVVEQLPDLLMGVSLFATKRMIVIKNLSENKSVWKAFSDWMDRISDDIDLILVDYAIDRRTATYKKIKQTIKVRDFASWTDRDVMIAEKWVINESKKMGFELDRKFAQFLINHVGVDQWQLFYAIEKLSLVDEISIDVIKNIIDSNPTENVFNLFETAINGDVDSLNQKIKNLQQTEDVYKLFGLLSAQVFQLVAIANVKNDEYVAVDFNIPKFVIQKMSAVSKKIGNNGIKKIVNIFVQAEVDMKTSTVDPWLVLQTALLKVGQLGR